jgi:PPM family protein phosphatase
MSVSAMPPSGAGRLFVTGAMLTDVGRVRETNEDSVGWLLPPAGDPRAARGMLAIVADGLGGHAAGEVASRMAVGIVLRHYYASAAPPPTALGEALSAADQAIREQAAKDAACAGMGSTCTAIAVQDGRAFLAHIGDSRAYLLRGGDFVQLSEDHSLVGLLVRSGQITAEEARIHPERHVILRALGVGDAAQISVWRDGMPLQNRDVLVLCSDGVFGLVPDPRIADIVGRLPPPVACRALIDAALAAGGDDNASIGVFALSDTAPATAGDDTTRRMPVSGPGGRAS